MGAALQSAGLSDEGLVLFDLVEQVAMLKQFLWFHRSWAEEMPVLRSKDRIIVDGIPYAYRHLLNCLHFEQDHLFTGDFHPLGYFVERRVRARAALPASALDLRQVFDSTPPASLPSGV